jgi:hypothetical protein
MAHVRLEKYSKLRELFVGYIAKNPAFLRAKFPILKMLHLGKYPPDGWSWRGSCGYAPAGLENEEAVAHI